MELSSRYPQEGGIYVWTTKAFGHVSGFISFVDILDEQPAFLFGGALFRRGFGAVCLWSARAQPGRQFIVLPALSLVWLTIITLLNIRGMNAGKWLNNVASLGSLLPLSALFVLAACRMALWFGDAHIQRRRCSSSSRSKCDFLLDDFLCVWRGRGWLGYGGGDREPAAQYPVRHSRGRQHPSAWLHRREQRLCWLRCRARRWAARTDL